MLVDFNHPLFRGRRPDDDDRSGPGGLMQPPGSRWDPVGPGFDVSGRRGLGSAGTRGDPTMGDPDFDELLPPGEHGPDLRMPGRGAGRGREGFDPFVGGGMGGFGRGGGGGFGGGAGGLGGLGGGGGGFYM